MKFFVFFGFVVLVITAVTDVAAEKKLSNILDEIIDVVDVDGVRSLLHHVLLNGNHGVSVRDEYDGNDFLSFVLNVVRDLDVNRDLLKAIGDSKIFDFVFSIWKVKSRADDFNGNVAADLLLNESKILKVLVNNFDDSRELRSLLGSLRSPHNRDVLEKHLRSNYGRVLGNHISNNYLLDNIVSKLRFLLL